MKINNKDYKLIAYYKDTEKAVSSYIQESRTYNSGLDIFIGSDCMAVSYLVIPLNKKNDFLGKVKEVFCNIKDEDIDSDCLYFCLSVGETDKFGYYLLSYGSDSEIYKELYDLSVGIYLFGAEINDIDLLYFAMSVIHHKTNMTEKLMKFNDDNVGFLPLEDIDDVDDFFNEHIVKEVEGFNTMQFLKDVVGFLPSDLYHKDGMRNFALFLGNK